MRRSPNTHCRLKSNALQRVNDHTDRESTTQSLNTRRDDRNAWTDRRTSCCGRHQTPATETRHSVNEIAPRILALFAIIVTLKTIAELWTENVRLRHELLQQASVNNAATANLKR
jgi:hypothetical protein